jgi:hypothetical protein
VTCRVPSPADSGCLESAFKLLGRRARTLPTNHESPGVAGTQARRRPGPGGPRSRRRPPRSRLRRKAISDRAKLVPGRLLGRGGRNASAVSDRDLANGDGHSLRASATDSDPTGSSAAAAAAPGLRRRAPPDSESGPRLCELRNMMSRGTAGLGVRRIGSASEIRLTSLMSRRTQAQAQAPRLSLATARPGRRWGTATRLTSVSR